LFIPQDVLEAFEAVLAVPETINNFPDGFYIAFAMPVLKRHAKQ